MAEPTPLRCYVCCKRWGTTAKPHTAISTSAAKSLTETRHLSVNYVQSGKFHYISSIFNTVRTAEERHISIEMAARELRYEWFEEIRRKSGANVIAVAHHRDDSVETLLLNLIRGTGINGLRGIRPKNEHIVRPLLCLDRKEIINYLNRTGQDYVTDSTNLQDEYTRNKIRLNLLPMMQEINPSVKESIFNTAEHLSEVSIIYKKSIEEATKRVQTAEGICIDALMQETAPETLLFEILYPLGFNAAQIRDIYRALEGQPGKNLFFGTLARCERS